MANKSLLEYTIASCLGGGLSWWSNRRIVPEVAEYFQANLSENQEQNILAATILLGSVTGVTLAHYWNKIPIVYAKTAGAIGAGFKIGMFTYGATGSIEYSLATAAGTGVAAFKTIGILDKYIKAKREQKKNTQNL